MTNEELNTMSEEVRNEGLHQGTSMKDLVFDPVSGDFRQVPRGTHRGDGDVVTEMTDKGFAAAEADIIVCLREDEIGRAQLQLNNQDEIPAYVYKRDDNVYHITTTPDKDIIPTAHFTKDSSRLDDRDLPYSEAFFILLNNGNPEVYRRAPVEKEDGWQLGGWERAELLLIPSKDNLFSRTKGILEVGILRNKRVLIIGLGSFGSQIAIELAKAGVGSFSLMDFDRVELHNLSRHSATVRDLGRLKTNVIEEAILGKNPYAQIDKFPIDINKDLPLLYEEVEKAGLVICATDNNTSRFNISKALVKKGKVGIFGRAITRAEGGDVFRYRPGGPCYCCMIGDGGLQQEEITDVSSARRDGRIAAYVSQEDAEAMVQVGLSSDIEPICNMMVKLALVELSRGERSGIASLEEEFVFDYYMWANRRERRYANWKPMPGAGGYPTILRWYGAHIQKEPNCPICSDQITLPDDGETVEGLENIKIDLS